MIKRNASLLLLNALVGLFVQFSIVFPSIAGHAFEEGKWDSYGIQVYYDKNFDCFPAMNLYVSADNKTVFQPPHKQLAEVLSAVRKNYLTWCPETKAIVVSGFLNGKRYYWANSSLATQWKLDGKVIEDDRRFLQPYMFPRDPDEKYKNAQMLLAGDRLAYNPKAAAYFMEGAVISQKPEIEYRYGYMIANGIGVEKNTNKAKFWIKKAADKNYQPAIDYLATMALLSKQDAERKVQHELAKRRKGIVYKSDQFWQSFANSNLYQKVFDGDLSGLNQRVDFKQFYVDFVGEYSASCKSMLPGKVDKVTYTTIEVRKDYGIESASIWDEVEILIDPRFTDAFQQYQDDLKLTSFFDSFELHMNLLKNLETKSLDQSLTEALWEMQLFEPIKLINQMPCNSASMFQMKENLLRAANNDESVQDAGVVIANAEQESDSVYAVVNTKTFKEACVAFFYKMNPRGNERFCTCMYAEAKKRFNAKKMETFSNNFATFWKDMDNYDAKGHDWDRQNTVNACRR
ncbi:tetratricopeptide repeat protein [Alteromonas antoniana]|uniref:tetratricopeptide repeat protein n=1 Tax=Alteromonas antoniana TaxID=2803813 RepID=UPI001C487D86|nr:hypothetical protein [Alteromonas antoniana]